MSEQAPTELSCGAGPWYPLRRWWQSSRLFNQDVGLPPFLEPGEPRWTSVDWLQRSLAAAAAAAAAWPAYAPAPLFVPHISGSPHHAGQIGKEPCKWRVSLDVAHFFPSEISLSVKDGFLQVGGRHEERRDEHGFIARCFTRKYRLPGEIDATTITSTLAADGILTVEAPVPETSLPAAGVITIKVEMEATGEQEEEHEKEESPEKADDSCRAPEALEFLPAEDHGEEESPPEVRGDEQARPGSATAGLLQQHEERREEEEEEEEAHGQPAEEASPSASADVKGAESVQVPSEQHEAPGSRESPDTDTSEQPEHKEPAVGGEVQVMADSVEAAEEIAPPEEPELGNSPPSEGPSQDPEAPDMKQEPTEE